MKSHLNRLKKLENKLMKSLWLLLLIVFCQPYLLKAQSDMKRIEGGTFVPLFGNLEAPTKVSDFLLDTYPVTHQEFLDFVKDNPQWQRSKISRLYADKNYLMEWESDTTLGAHINPDAAVTHVSWFAANAYAQAQGKRLPTTDEWEYVAMANATIKDARTDSLYNQRILSWYEKPKANTSSVGKQVANFWGIHDLFGLVWEWTDDFNSVLITGESRGDMDENNKLFCGGGSVGATDMMNYSAFMRFAFKGSLKASYSIKNLGFRCAKDLNL